MTEKRDDVKFVEIETYVHATEDIDKVIEAIKEVILRDAKTPIILEVLWGTFGNRIVRVKIFLENENATNILKRVICNLSNLDRLLSTLRDRLDRAGNLFIRLNKQELIKGKIVLDDESDDIVRIKARISRRLLKEGLENLVEKICGK
ncbi:MAG: exosome protein [Crenarchaeota archaeon]|nr:exosome protein [Thermoproteota archaeon]